MVYFDNSATTRPCREAIDAATEVVCDIWGNPSSTHSKGREAKKALENARESVAAALGCPAAEVYFTSGGTESDNWAVNGAWRMKHHDGRHIITSAVEHDAILKSMQRLEKEGPEVPYLKPDKWGRITAEAVAEALREDTILVSVMLVNNETGAVNPISDIARVIKAKGSSALLHTDAVQGFLKVPFTAKSLGADMISVSAHKIHAFKGCGALWIRKGVRLPQFITGGGQENAMRPGTEAMPAIAAFGAASAIGKKLFAESEKQMRSLRNYAVERLSEELPGTVFIGEGDAPHILSISLPGYGSEVLMNCLDADGICVSKSSACKKGARSHVLEAMELPADIIDGAIRVSFCRYNTADEVDTLVSSLKSAVSRLRSKK